MNTSARINWTNTLFLTLTPLIGLFGTLYLVLSHQVSAATWVLAFVLYWVTGTAITAGYHRLFAHSTYRAVWPIRLIFLLLAAATFQGSVFEWSSDHRRHHRYTDTDKDPYNIQEGFWHAHINWLIFLDTKKRDFSNISDLTESLLARLQHRFFVPLAIIMGFVLPACLASLWGEFWAGLIVAGALRITFVHHSTFCINSLCHMVGKTTYSQKISARDNGLSALFTFGEGYHNYHHQFPLDYRNGIRFYQFDPTKWLIALLSYLGLASNLRRIPKYRIIQAVIESHTPEETPSEEAHRHSALMSSLRESILELIAHIKGLEKYCSETTGSLEAQQKIKTLSKELRRLFRAWHQLKALAYSS